MAKDTITLELSGKKTLKRGGVAKDIIEVAEKDYQTVLRSIAAQEIAEQKAIGNEPSNIIVDNKRKGRISDAKYSVVTYFVDAKSMIAALEAVWNRLHEEARQVTGKTAQQFEVWASEGPGKARFAGRNPGAISADAINIRTGLYVVGPMVGHARKFQWYFGAGPRRIRERKKRGAAMKGIAMRDRPKTPLSIHERAAADVQRKFRWLRVTDCFVQVPNLNPNGSTPVDRVPAVSVWSRNKGRL